MNYDTEENHPDDSDTPRRFCFTHGYSEDCGAVACEVIEEAVESEAA